VCRKNLADSLDHYFRFRRKAMKRVVTYFFGRVVVLSGFRVPVLLVSEDRVVGGDVF
jgi:hypothetical protein